MSTERDAGLQALQAGNPAAAAPLLETACQQDPSDFDALLFLGAAYGQLGRQMDAINTITRAVQLQPANAQARYNLAVAMEQGGYREQAVQALGQALTLQPDYPKAQEALRRLQGGAASGGQTAPLTSGESAAAQGSGQMHGTPSSASSNQGFGAPMSAEQPSSGAAPYGAPAQQPPANEAGLPQFGFGQVGGGSGTVQLGAMPPTGEQPAASAGPQWGAPSGSSGGAQPPAQPLYGAPPPSGTYGQPPQSSNTAGSSVRRPDLAGSPVETPYGAPTQNASPGPYGNPYGAPVNQGLYSQSMATVGGGMRNNSYVDSFDLGEAFKSWGRLLTQPSAFFQEMTGTTGFSAPMALALLYLGPFLISAIINTVKIQMTVGSSASNPAYLIGMIFGMVIGIAIAVPFILAGMMFFAWILHLIGLLFGNKAPFSASFRALVFAYAPMPLLGIPIALFSGGVNGFNPIGLLIGLIGFIWFTVLLVLGISSEQELATGPAVGVVIITDIVLGVIGVVLGLIFSALLVGIIAAAGKGFH